MTERICKRCGKAYVLGSRGVCTTCRQEPAPNGTPQLRKMRDSKIDMGYAAEELRRAKEEIDAIPSNLQRHRREAELIEPLARIALVKRFVDGVLRRHGVKVQRTDVDDEDEEDGNAG